MNIFFMLKCYFFLIEILNYAFFIELKVDFELITSNLISSLDLDSNLELRDG